MAYCSASASRHARRRARPGATQLALHQRLHDLVAQLASVMPLRLQALAEDVLVELAGEAGRRGSWRSRGRSCACVDDEALLRRRRPGARRASISWSTDASSAPWARKARHVERRAAAGAAASKLAVDLVVDLVGGDRLAVDRGELCRRRCRPAGQAAEAAEAAGAEAGDDDRDQGEEQQAIVAQERATLRKLEIMGVLTEVGLRGS